MKSSTKLLQPTIQNVVEKLKFAIEIKRILEKVVNPSRKDWSKHLDDALWEYITAYKNSLGMSSYILVYGKACHLLIELEHKALWAAKILNFNLSKVVHARMLQLTELEEHRLFSYENAELYKEKAKRWHDSKCHKRELIVGKQVLLFNSRLKLFLGKLKSRWSGPFKLMRVYPHGEVDLLNERTWEEFKMNGKMVKAYHDESFHNTRINLDLQEYS